MNQNLQERGPGVYIPGWSLAKSDAVWCSFNDHYLCLYHRKHQSETIALQEACPTGPTMPARIMCYDDHQDGEKHDFSPPNGQFHFWLCTLLRNVIHLYNILYASTFSPKTAEEFSAKIAFDPKSQTLISEAYPHISPHAHRDQSPRAYWGGRRNAKFYFTSCLSCLSSPQNKNWSLGNTGIGLTRSKLLESPVTLCHSFYRKQVRYLLSCSLFPEKNILMGTHCSVWPAPSTARPRSPCRELYEDWSFPSPLLLQKQGKIRGSHHQPHADLSSRGPWCWESGRAAFRSWNYQWVTWRSLLLG